MKRKINFKDYFDLVGATYRSVDVRALLIRPESEWVNCMVAFYPTSRDENSLAQEHKSRADMLEKLGIIKLANVKFMQEIIKPNTLPDLLDQMLKGSLSLGNYSIRMRDGYQKLDFSSDEGYAIRHGEYPISGYYVGSTENADALLYKLDLKDEFLVLGLDMDEFAADWLGVRGLSRASNSVVVLPVYASLVNIKYLGNGRVSVQLKVHKALASNLSLIIRTKRYDPRTQTYRSIETYPQALASFSTELQNDFTYVNAYHEFATSLNEDDLIHAIVTSGILGVVTERSANVREVFPYRPFKDIFLHTSTRFVSLGHLEDCLVNPVGKVGASKANDLFERAVAWLMSLLDFRQIEIGDLGLGVLREDKYEIGEADILAEDLATRRVYVISCSLKPPGADKLDKIANISSFFKERGVMTEPLALVSEEAGEVKRDVRRVRVLDREDLIKVIQLLNSESVDGAKKIFTGPRP